MGDYRIAEGYLPGIIGRMTELHATYYGRLWELGPRFEGEMAEGIAEFVTRYDPARDGLWTIVDSDESVMGGIIIDSRSVGDEGAQLRYFILSPNVQGHGFGRTLLTEAMEFCIQHKYDRVFLWTVDELEAAIYLYQDVGFEPTDEIEMHTDWQTTVPYRRFVCELY